MQENKLWYRQPAKEWTDSLPLGNGRIGAMVFGGVLEERIALNEDTLWSGYPQNKNNVQAAKHLSKARELAYAQKNRELTELIEGHMLGDYSESYLPLGDIYLRFPQLQDKEVSAYYRDLNLNDATSHTQYRIGDVTWNREAFVSHPAQALIMKISADHNGQISFLASFSSLLRTTAKAQGNQIIIEGIAPSHVEPSYLECENPVIYEEEASKKGMRFCGILEICTSGGTVTSEGDSLRVQNADEAVLIFTVRTSFNGYDKSPWKDGKDYYGLCVQDLSNVADTNYDEWLKMHIRDHRSFFDRVDFYLEKKEEEDIPTDERLARFLETQDDKQLYQLIFQYGRYLLITSSREGSQPANLQGIWNQELRAPWSSNYTLNINTEMNYWLAESCNLTECHEPLFRLVEELRDTGAKTAVEHYGVSGVTAHHNTDIWRMANPVGRNDKGTIGYAYWCMSFGWLCQHLYTHYEYTLDKEFLRNKAYPAIRSSAEFYLNMLTEDADGTLILSPSTSPENKYLLNGEEYKVAKTTTMTIAIIREVFRNCIECCDILDIDAEFRKEIADAYGKMAYYKIGHKGNLMEWYDDYEDAEIAHRHISHLYPLYPGNEITLERTPDLAEACKRALEIRGDEGTGWSLGWKINTWARLRDGNHAEKLLKRQLKLVDTDEYNYSNGGGTYRNMFDAHPPFQIDGNFAASAGIAEMFVQNEDDVIILLPALPDAWENGYMKGLCAKGGVEVDIYFKDHKLEKAVFRLKTVSEDEKTIRICYKDEHHSFVFSKYFDKVAADYCACATYRPFYK